MNANSCCANSNAENNQANPDDVSAFHSYALPTKNSHYPSFVRNARPIMSLMKPLITVDNISILNVPYYLKAVHK